MRLSDERGWAGPFFDAHAHIGRSLFGVELSVDDLLASMDGNGVERAVLAPLKPPGYDLAPENDRVGQAVRLHGDRFCGFARVDPWQGERAVVELRRAHEDLGARGLFLHPFEEQFAANSELVFPLMELLQERGLPLLLAGGYPLFSHPSQVGDLAQRFPGVTIIATHGGQLNISGLLLDDASRMLRSNPNVIMETSGVYREDFIEDMVSELGAGRVLFGSNAPYMDQGFETLRVRLAHLSATDKRALGYENMAGILGV
jgi:uncharacterized protein